MVWFMELTIFIQMFQRHEDLKYLANLDYIAFINWQSYTEKEQRKVA